MSKVAPNTLSVFSWPVAADGPVPKRADVAVLGAPVDRFSAVGGASEAPDRMRALPHYDRHGTFDLSTVRGVDIGNTDAFAADPLNDIARAVRTVPGTTFLVVLGGDDTVSLPVCQERAEQVIHFDAHTDMWQYPELRHGSWMNSVKVPVQQFGTRVGPDTREEMFDAGKRTVLCVDIDVVDPAFAPGVSYPVPGGWTSEKLLSMVTWALTSYDVRTLVVTEVNPSRDHNDMTSWLAQFVVVKAIQGFAAKKVHKGRRSMQR